MRWEAAGESRRQGRSREGETAGVRNLHFHQQPGPDTAVSQRAVQTGLLGCPQPGVPAGARPPERGCAPLPPPCLVSPGHSQYVLYAVSIIVPRNDESPNSALTLPPHTTVVHALSHNGPSATHALRRQRLLPEEENLPHFLVMNPPLTPPSHKQLLQYPRPAPQMAVCSYFPGRIYLFAGSLTFAGKLLHSVNSKNDNI